MDPLILLAGFVGIVLLLMVGAMWMAVNELERLTLAARAIALELDAIQRTAEKLKTP